MNITKDIQSMTTFRNNSAEFTQYLQETGNPLVLTVNGAAAVVVQSAEAYQRLHDLAEKARVLEAIREGEEDVKAGRTRPVREAFNELRAKRGLPRRTD